MIHAITFSRFATLLMIAAISVSGAAHGKTLYVEKWGANNDNCTKTTPCQTIQHAINRSSANGKIKVGPGMYEENLEINTNHVGLLLDGLKLESTTGRYSTIVHSVDPNLPALTINQPKVQIGKKGKGFTFAGTTGTFDAAILVDVVNPAGKVKIEGNRIGWPRKITDLPNDDYANYYGIEVTQVGYKIQIRNNIFQNVWVSVIICRTCNQAIIKDNRIESSGEGLYLISSNKASVLKNLSSSNRFSGLRVAASSTSFLFKDNVVERNTEHGIRFESAKSANTQGNISAYNSEDGINISQSSEADATRLKNNLSIGNSDHGFRLFNLENAWIEGNTAMANTLDGIDLLGTAAIRSIKNNNTIANGNCGLEGDSGITYATTRHYSVGNSLNFCDATYTGAPVSKANPIKVNGARTLVGG